MDTTTVYADIVKVDENPDGTVNVFGRATSDDLDSDRQICDPDWLKSAMPDWFRWGNVREQHSSIAAGVGKALEQEGSGWNLSSHVVDLNSARKCKLGVLKGYSIGISNPRVVTDASAPGGRIVGGQIVEVSLVDRPANPTCTLALAKALKPGPDISKAAAVDTERRLVKVEELHDRTAEPLEALEKALQGFDLVAVQKGNSKAQIKDARKAIALLAGVVQAEAACLADGSGTASCDIDLVMGAIHAIEYFVNREQEAAMAHVELSETPDATKAAAPEAPAAPPAEQAPSTETPPPAAEKAVEGESTTGVTPEKTPDLTELVKAAVAEAVAPLQERLAKAEAAPRDGGPVLARTAQAKAAAGAREEHLSKAADFEAKASLHQGQAREGYLALAAQERDKAATITS